VQFISFKGMGNIIFFRSFSPGISGLLYSTSPLSPIHSIFSSCGTGVYYTRVYCSQVRTAINCYEYNLHFLKFGKKPQIFSLSPSPSQSATRWLPSVSMRRLKASQLIFYPTFRTLNCHNRFLRFFIRK
jgi:hypothetical protein